ncbi:BtpA/SgcQ family protein [Pyrococcus sp. NA2]|uniref:BtpA/SgcQ family protein n=1 Tax=Pyrococcus sp. (strain NA2) TaxID=342949 RepID=UPI00064E88B6|nr:BtpA/SgcQ family protein [Pyrococcus sp. NA2]
MNFEDKPLIGVVHLKPLPGAPKYSGSIKEIIDDGIRKAKVYEEAGFDGVIIENFGDVPYGKELSKETLASFAVVAKAIKDSISIPLGINALRNDCISAYSIAYAIGGNFIRVNVLTGVAFTDQGIIEGCARELAMLKVRLPGKIEVLADVHVKHAVHFSRFEDAIKDTIERGMADAIIITGSRTGEPPGIEEVKRAKEISSVPVIVGSGVNDRNIKKFLKYADGIIVGTWVEGNLERAKKLVKLKKEVI